MEQFVQPTFGRRQNVPPKKEQAPSRSRFFNITIILLVSVAGFVAASLFFGNTKFYYSVSLSGSSTLSQKLDWCSGKNDASIEQQISGCTALIDSGRGNAHGLSEALYNRGNAYATTGDFNRAIMDYDQAIQLNPTMANAYDNRGRAYSEQNQIERAISDYNEAIRLDPNSAVALHNRCWARVVMGHLADALSDCDESLRLNPNNAATLGTRGFVYLKAGAFDKAIVDYDAALQNDPKMLDLKKAVVLYGRGLAKEKQDSSGANADIFAAKAIIPDISEQFARYGAH
jgi:tetratricopeptide (TPR) repeat protein